jgi:hypothetical protein
MTTIEIPSECSSDFLNSLRNALVRESNKHRKFVRSCSQARRLSNDITSAVIKIDQALRAREAKELAS